MRVQVLHDRFIRLQIASDLESVVHVRVDKQHVTAMCKGVGSSWSAESATVNLSPNPLVDIMLYSTSPHQHRVVVSNVIDEGTVQALHQVVLDGRHMVSTSLCDAHFVLGAEAIAKHLIAKHVGIPALRCTPHAVRPYCSLPECEAQFQAALMRTESARQRRGAEQCRVKTIGSPAFRLFQRFNTTSTSKITSAFPAHSLAFAQSVCLAAGFLANATSEKRAGVLLAHSLQQIAVSAQTEQHILMIANAAVSDSTEKSAPEPSAPSDPMPTVSESAESDGESDTESAADDAGAAPEAASDAAPEDASDETSAAKDAGAAAGPEFATSGHKLGRLRMLLDSGMVYTTPFVTLGDETRRLLASSNVLTRGETPMYMVFDRQRNAVLVADVAMHKCEVLGGGVQMHERSPTEQAVADMHFVNVSTAYHPELLPRRELLLKKACKSVAKPSRYTASILQMLRFEEGPMLALLAQQDL